MKARSVCPECVGRGSVLELSRFDHSYIDIPCFRCMGFGFLIDNRTSKTWDDIVRERNSDEAVYIAADFVAATESEDA